jgi:hypothetical protein
MIKTFTISETSPAAANTVVGATLRGLADFEFFRVDARLVGATGGNLNVYLQRKVREDVWADWLRFPQLAAADPAVNYTLLAGNPTLSTAITTPVGIGSDAAPGVAIAVNTFLGGHPGEAVRAVYVAGASTSAGAAVLIYLTCWRRP